MAAYSVLPLRLRIPLRWRYRSANVVCAGAGAAESGEACRAAATAMNGRSVVLDISWVAGGLPGYAGYWGGDLPLASLLQAVAGV